jgi:hypothetical protein
MGVNSFEFADDASTAIGANSFELAVNCSTIVGANSFVLAVPGFSVFCTVLLLPYAIGPSFPTSISLLMLVGSSSAES